MLSRQLNKVRPSAPKAPSTPKTPNVDNKSFNPDDFKVDYSKPNIFEKGNFNLDDMKVDYSKPNIFENNNKINGNSQKAYEDAVNQIKKDADSRVFDHTRKFDILF